MDSFGFGFLSFCFALFVLCHTEEMGVDREKSNDTMQPAEQPTGNARDKSSGVVAKTRERYVCSLSNLRH
jgi:hypothetical protein